MKYLMCVALVFCLSAAVEANGFAVNRVNNRRVVVVQQPHVNFGGFNYGAAFASPCQVNTFAAQPCFGSAVNYGVNVGGCFGSNVGYGFNNVGFGYGAAFGNPVVLRNRFVGARVVNPFFGFGRGFGLRLGFGF